MIKAPTKTVKARFSDYADMEFERRGDWTLIEDYSGTQLFGWGTSSWVKLAGQDELIYASYGWLLAPGYIPKGLTWENGALSGTVIRSKESGELVRDQIGRGFWSGYYEDGSPKSGDDIPIPTGFTVAASKLGLLRCGLLPPEETKTTNFGRSVPVTIIHCAMPYGSNGLDHAPAGYYDAYQATFALNGVNYEVFAQRLELEEVIQIAASVIGGQSGESITVGGAQEP